MLFDLQRRQSGPMPLFYRKGHRPKSPLRERTLAVWWQSIQSGRVCKSQGTRKKIGSLKSREFFAAEIRCVLAALSTAMQGYRRTVSEGPLRLPR